MPRAEAVAVEFDGPGAATLRGHHLAAGESWAVLVHDEGGDLDGWRGLAPDLCASGLGVLAFDLPGHGASDDPWEPKLAAAAARAAIDFARSQGARQVHLVAAGAGALAALAAAAGDAGGIASAVLLTPRPDDRVAALDEVREARMPKLIMVGSLDQRAVEDAETTLRAAIGPCQVVRFPVTVQGTELLTGEWGQHAREKVLAHIRRWRC